MPLGWVSILPTRGRIINPIMTRVSRRVFLGGAGGTVAAWTSAVAAGPFVPNEVANPSKRTVAFFEHVVSRIAAVLF